MILITGASYGLGRVFAEQLAARGQDLLLCARSANALGALAQTLKAQHRINVQLETSDLSVPGAAERLAQRCQQESISGLINNAGFGLGGEFAGQPLERIRDMLNLNIVALTELTHLLIPQIRNTRGFILNVASTAGFQAMANFAVYAASKAYVLHFTEALHQELRTLGVEVLALCPGPTATEFFRRANITFKLPYPLDSPEMVVRTALQALDDKESRVITGFKNQLAIGLGGLLPRQWRINAASRFARGR